LDLCPAYAGSTVSFITIGIIWVNHHAVFASVPSVDRTLLSADTAADFRPRDSVSRRQGGGSGA
jgi:hypothetical protein